VLGNVEIPIRKPLLLKDATWPRIVALLQARPEFVLGGWHRLQPTPPNLLSHSVRFLMATRTTEEEEVFDTETRFPEKKPIYGRNPRLGFVKRK
jgi:hypothetical protein